MINSEDLGAYFDSEDPQRDFAAQDSTAPRIVSLEECMTDKSAPLNAYFHKKFEQFVRGAGMTFADESGRHAVKLAAYFFYLQGQAHARKWQKENL